MNKRRQKVLGAAHYEQRKCCITVMGIEKEDEAHCAHCSMFRDDRHRPILGAFSRGIGVKETPTSVAWHA